MDESRFIAILITENYNTTVWTKREYKKALAREQQELGMVQGLSSYRVSCALSNRQPQNVGDVHRLLESIGFEPFVVLGGDDFAEMVKNGGELVTEDYAHFDPGALLRSAAVSDHVKALVRDLIP